MRKTAVLFQTHFFDRWAEKAFRRLRDASPPHRDVVVLLHLPAGAPVPDLVKRYPHHVVRTPELRELPYPAKVNGGTQWSPEWNLWQGGHTDLITMHYWCAHAAYDDYWVIEYDVRFSGAWSHFFAAFEQDYSDLLAPLLCRRRDYPEWENWPSLVSPDTPPDDTEAVRSFMPIYRVSGHLLRTLDQAYRDGWGGHLECSLATIAQVRGLRITDFGGDGEFTPEPYRGRFYSGTVHDVYHAPGTLVFKPVFFRIGSRPDMLWHPVKPFWWKAELRQDLLAARREIGRLIRGRAPWLLPARWRQPGCFSGRDTARTS